jgi:hypothetical protein
MRVCTFITFTPVAVFNVEEIGVKIEKSLGQTQTFVF